MKEETSQEDRIDELEAENSRLERELEESQEKVAELRNALDDIYKIAKQAL